MPARERSSRAGGSLDYQRVMTRIEALVASSTERFEAVIDRVDKRFERLEGDVAKGALEQGSLVNELAEFRNETGDLRDLVGKLRNEIAEARGEPLEAAARGAAEGAAHGASAVKGGFWATWKGWAVAVGVGVAGVGAAIDNLPRVIRALEGLWEWGKRVG